VLRPNVGLHIAVAVGLPDLVSILSRPRKLGLA